MRGFVLASLCLAAVLLLPVTSAAAKTWFATPNPPAAQPCTPGAPCTIETAVAEADNGDTVLVGPGEYQLAGGGVNITKEIEIGGEVGERPILRTKKGTGVQVTQSADATVHDLTLEGGGPLVVESGLVERAYVSYSGEGEVDSEPPGACLFRLGTGHETATMRDSVCWAHDLHGPSDSHAVAASVVDSGGEKTLTLRNVTAVAAGNGGNGLDATAASGTTLRVDAKGVIARSENGYDVAAGIDDPKGTSRVFVTLTGSNYASIRDDQALFDVTDPGTEGNQVAAPEFVDAAEGDFAPAATSPVLDTGVLDELSGATDIDGIRRPQASCLGANAKTVADIGAYERVATQQCKTAPPPPPPPPDPFVPRFRVLNLKLNKRSGGGKVEIEVPSAGVASVTGSGIKFLSRTSSGAGKLTLPIQPWAVTLVRLNKLGKTKVKLKVLFEPTGTGQILRTSRSLVLKRKRRSR